LYECYQYCTSISSVALRISVIQLDLARRVLRFEYEVELEVRHAAFPVLSVYEDDISIISVALLISVIQLDLARRVLRFEYEVELEVLSVYEDDISMISVALRISVIQLDLARRVLRFECEVELEVRQPLLSLFLRQSVCMQHRAFCRMCITGGCSTMERTLERSCLSRAPH
jgi:hypothetical protein